MLYAKAVMYLAAWMVKQGHRAMLSLRTRLFEQAPTITQTTGIASAPRHTRFYLFGNSLHGLLQTLRQDASQFRADAERAVKHLRLLMRHS